MQIFNFKSMEKEIKKIYSQKYNITYEENKVST